MQRGFCHGLLDKVPLLDGALATCADLQLGADVVLFVWGGLHIGGSADQPVTIRTIEPGLPFGSVRPSSSRASWAAPQHGSARWWADYAVIQ